MTSDQWRRWRWRWRRGRWRWRWRWWWWKTLMYFRIVTGMLTPNGQVWCRGIARRRLQEAFICPWAGRHLFLRFAQLPCSSYGKLLHHFGTEHLTCGNWYGMVVICSDIWELRAMMLLKLLKVLKILLDLLVSNPSCVFDDGGFSSISQK